MSIASSIASNIDDGNTLSQSLLNDSNFWKDFLKDDCHLASHSSRITEENEQFLLAKERTDSLQTTVEISKCEAFSVLENINYEVKQIPHTIIGDYSHSSTENEFTRYAGKYPKKVYGHTKSKQYKYDRQLTNKCSSSNSYLHKIKYHIEKCIENKIPTFLIKDISKAKQYSIFNEFICKHLYEVHGIIFQNVICRASIVGLIKQGNVYKVLLDDGTASMWCNFYESFSQTNEVENFPIPYDSQVSYQAVTLFSDLERGITVHVLGALNKYYKTFFIKKMYRENEVIVRRELSYLHYIQNLTETYETWRQDILNIYKI